MVQYVVVLALRRDVHLKDSFRLSPGLTTEEFLWLGSSPGDGVVPSDVGGQVWCSKRDREGAEPT